MRLDEIQRVTVVGAGLMGHGIAQEFAVAGYEVRLHDTSDANLERAMAGIRANLALMANAGMVDQEQANAAPDRLHPTTSLAEAGSDADVVVEAVFENLELKQQIFAELDEVCPPHAILASNSSSYMPGKLAASTARPAQVLVAHYFNPPHLMPLVELVRHPETSDETVETMFALYMRIGKKPVIIQHEAPGFVANRLQMAIWREAANIVARGICAPQDVDTVVRYGFGRRYAAGGPFELGALISADVRRAVAAEIMPDLANSVPDLDRGAYSLTAEEAEQVRLRVAHALLEIAKWDG
ncbi:MAG TPA: 3-hydroxyacyl-CoA dehydrogenase family protein [Thermomicrobiales bacterium]|nr:3-hydroxyacyl-CoA dehydrogenase family protein [Thermomicrobiales bacterium]